MNVHVARSQVLIVKKENMGIITLKSGSGDDDELLVFLEVEEEVDEVFSSLSVESSLS